MEILIRKTKWPRDDFTIMMGIYKPEKTLMILNQGTALFIEEKKFPVIVCMVPASWFQ